MPAARHTAHEVVLPPAGGGLSLSGGSLRPSQPLLTNESQIVVGARVRVRDGVTPSQGWGAVTKESVGTVVAVQRPPPVVSLTPKVGDTLIAC